MTNCTEYDVPPCIRSPSAGALHTERTRYTPTLNKKAFHTRISPVQPGTKAMPSARLHHAGAPKDGMHIPSRWARREAPQLRIVCAPVSIRAHGPLGAFRKPLCSCKAATKHTALPPAPETRLTPTVTAPHTPLPNFRPLILSPPQISVRHPLRYSRTPCALPSHSTSPPCPRTHARPR